jgi:methylmalonyl-CoA mutase C-terminal domain/subunit
MREIRMNHRKVRILMARLGGGYNTAMHNLASAFSKAGFEVIYTDSQDPRAIVTSAIQESVDHIGITTLPGADPNDFANIIELLNREGVSEIKVTAGGFLVEDAIPVIKEMGVLEFFPKGTTYEELIEWGRHNIKAAD